MEIKPKNLGNVSNFLCFTTSPSHSAFNDKINPNFPVFIDHDPENSENKIYSTSKRERTRSETWVALWYSVWLSGDDIGRFANSSGACEFVGKLVGVGGRWCLLLRFSHGDCCLRWLVGDVRSVVAVRRLWKKIGAEDDSQCCEWCYCAILNVWRYWDSLTSAGVWSTESPRSDCCLSAVSVEVVIQKLPIRNSLEVRLCR